MMMMSFLPKDKFYFIFILFFINGIGTLLPWNMLINADKYFVDYKLNVTNPTPAVMNYKDNFLQYLGIASKAPNILLQILNMVLSSSDANLTRRVSITLIIQISVFLFIIAVAIIDSSHWPDAFFWVTMASAAVINLANGAYQGCVYGLAARFPMQYTNSVTTGMNMSGTLASMLSIISIAISPSHQIEAIIFFSCAVFLLGVCFVGQFLIVRDPFFKHYALTEKCMRGTINTQLSNSDLEVVSCTDESYDSNGSQKKAAIESPTTISANLASSPQIRLAISRSTSYDGQKPKSKWPEGVEELTGWRMYLYILRCIWLQLVNIILIYFVSLSLFPAVHARILPVDNIISETYFSPVFCFLFFNVFATLGNFIAQFIKFPGPNYLIIFTVARLAFVPFFLYCNYVPGDSRTLPVIFDRDWHYIVGSVLMATTSGYFSSLAMMYTPRCVPPKFATTAGMLAALTIILGILAGITMALVYPKIVSW